VDRPFEVYATTLGLPGSMWAKAHQRLEQARQTTNKCKQAQQDPPGEYRLLTALDYYLQARSTDNVYIQFLLMVFVVERLFKKRRDKGDTVRKRIRCFVPDYADDQLESDYKARNDLVHGPKRIIEPDEAGELAERWSTISTVILSRILTEDWQGELPNLDLPKDG
jgi:hypothetical protein